MLADVRFMISLHFLLWNLGVGNCTVVFVVNTMFLNFLSSTQGTSSLHYRVIVVGLIVFLK